MLVHSKMYYLEKINQHKETIIGGKLWNVYWHNLITVDRNTAPSQDCASSFQCFLTLRAWLCTKRIKTSWCGIILILIWVTRQAASWQAIPLQFELIEQQPTAVLGVRILGGLGAQETVTCFDSWLCKFDAAEKHHDSESWDSTVGSGWVCGTMTASPSCPLLPNLSCSLHYPVYHWNPQSLSCLD